MPAASAKKRAHQHANKAQQQNTAPTMAMSPQPANSTTLDGPRPISTSDSLSSSAASTCQLEAFCTFIKLADLEIINVILTTATSSPGSQNLKALWDCAFKEGYESCVEETQTQFKNQLDMVTEDLNTQHEEMIQHVLADISEHQQEWRDEQYVEAFALGRTTGIQEECEYWDSVCKNQIDIGIQVRPTTATASVQTNFPIIPQSSASISTQTEPTLLSKNVSESSPVPISFPSPQYLLTLIQHLLTGQAILFYFQLYLWFL